MAESFRARWGRRTKTIPAMLAATALGLLLVPLALPVLAVADLARGRRRLPSVRVYLFLLQYGVNDSVEIVLAPIYWAAGGFGTRLDGPSSVARHRRLQDWSVELLARRAEQLLGLRIELEPGSLEALTPVPAVVVCRHVNLVDASLPGVLYLRLGIPSRGVIMAELLADPGFDLIYPRTGSVFIPRDRGQEAVATIERLGATDPDGSSATIVFPEGRLFRPDRLRRDLERLGDSNPARAERLASLRHLLPPRPAGVLTLLDVIEGDVVVIAHAGLDRFPSFGALARSVPLADPIRVQVRRFPRAGIPDGDEARIAWLDERWLEVDHWVGDQVPTPDGNS